MANRDYKMIKRTMGDFSANLGGGAGLTSVDKLPKTGDVNTLYKLPNGDIYSFYREVEKIPVYKNLAVGKDYKFVIDEEVINTDEFKFAMGVLFGTTGSFDVDYEEPIEDSVVTRFEILLTEGGAEVKFICNDLTKSVRYVGEEGSLRVILGEAWGTDPHVIITQEFADELNSELGFSLENIEHMFIREIDHYDDKVTEGWIKVSGAEILELSKINNNAIYLDDDNYDALNIYNNVLRGADYILKEENDEYSASYNKLQSSYININSECALEFGNYTIDIYLENQYMHSIKGSVINEIIKDNWMVAIGWNNLCNYISSQLSEEEREKYLAQGTIISTLDGNLIMEKYDNPPTEEQWCGVNGVLTTINGVIKEENLSSGSEFFNFNNIPNFKHNPYSDPFVFLDDNKEYSTDITITFADGTTKTIKTSEEVWEYDSGDYSIFIYAGE